jgi:hypothetical protein
MTKTISFSREVPDDIYEIMTNVAKVACGTSVEVWIWGAVLNQLKIDIESDLEGTALYDDYSEKAEKYFDQWNLSEKKNVKEDTED